MDKERNKDKDTHSMFFLVSVVCHIPSHSLSKFEIAAHKIL